MKLFSTLFVSLVSCVASFAQNGGSSVVSVPAGDPTDSVFVNDEFSYANNVFVARSLRSLKVYFLANNEVVLQEPLNGDGFIKGTYNASSNTVVFANKQVVKNVEGKDLFFSAIDATTKQPLEGSFVLNVKDVNGKKELSVDNTLHFALYNLDSGKATINSETKNLDLVSSSVFNASKTKVQYSAMSALEESEVSASLDAVLVGSSLYIRGLDNTFKSSFLRFVVFNDNDNKTLSFTSNQYLGAYDEGGHSVLSAGMFANEEMADFVDINNLSKPLVLNTSTKNYEFSLGELEFLGAKQITAEGEGEWTSLFLNAKLSIPESLINGATTSISKLNVTVEVTNVSNVYFDLQGRKVEKPSHGIFILNGKKVFVK